MQVLLAALCLVMILEGTLPFAAPRLWRRMARDGSEMSESTLRLVGGGLMGFGLLCLMWGRNG